MVGSVRSVCVFSSLLFSLFMAGTMQSGSSKNNSGKSCGETAGKQTAAPVMPHAAVKPVADDFHGTRVVDNYRWLEDGNSPETQKWVAGEMAYTRSVLDPLPGREEIHKRLTELLSIGSITAPQIAGRYYFYTRREGMQ